MADEMSVTDLRLFGSSHRGTMLPDKDMAVLIGRVRQREPQREPQCKVEEIITPRPSPKDREVRIPPKAPSVKPQRIPTRASGIPVFTPDWRASPKPRESPPKAAASPPKRPSTPRVSARASPRPSLRDVPSPGRGFSSLSSSSSSRSSFGSRPPSPRPSPPRAPPAQEAPKPSESVNWRQVFADADFKPEDFADINVEKENASPHTRREKQEVLFQLLKTYPDESKGQWTMSVPLVELRYEWSRREHFRQEQSQVEAMKMGLKMLLHAIEAINTKVKSPIHLKGWARSATVDMSQYERPLRGLYYMYLRKRQMSPFAELGWIIITSAAVWHFQSVMGGPMPSELDDVHDIPAPKKQKGFNMGGLAQLAKMFM